MFSFCIESYSQIIFEKGYFIDETNEKIECLIKNVDWKNSPHGFKYKLTDNSTIQEATINDVKEFVVSGYSKYIRAKVNIDRSKDRLSELSTNKNPEFKEEEIFLKVLIEGDASLFVYNEGNLKRFFYRVNDSQISQLVYKQYRTNKKISQNNHFKQQLLNDLKSDLIVFNDIKNIKYDQKQLERLFVKFNGGVKTEFTGSVIKPKRDLFNLSIRPGFNVSSFSAQSFETKSKKQDFDTEIAFRLGVELEFILPFNKNKWAVIFEPTFQSYKTSLNPRPDITDEEIPNSFVDYKYFEVPIGVRHYFFLNQDSKLFADLTYTLQFPSDSWVGLAKRDFWVNKWVVRKYEVKTGNNFALGFGYKYKDKYSMQVRYMTNRTLTHQTLWESDYKSVQFIFGYTIF